MLQGLKRASLPLGVLAVGIAIMAVLIALKPKPEAASELPRPGRVHIATAALVVTQLRVDTYGEVRPNIQTDVVAQVAGRVADVSQEFVEGGRFEAGEILLSLPRQRHDAPPPASISKRLLPMLMWQDSSSKGLKIPRHWR